ncbi:MAG: hypothetical protein AB7N24_21205 [Dehalococcoidia bacterium]
MDDRRPFMLVRARAREASRMEFDDWFDRVHLKDVAKIPGVVGVLKGRNADGTRVGIYTFESTDALQPALASPEASYARGTWERWQPELEELLIELWSVAFPIPLYQGTN